MRLSLGTIIMKPKSVTVPVVKDSKPLTSSPRPLVSDPKGPNIELPKSRSAPLPMTPNVVVPPVPFVEEKAPVSEDKPPIIEDKEKNDKPIDALGKGD